jgi:hypothetical protein
LGKLATEARQLGRQLLEAAEVGDLATTSLNLVRVAQASGDRFATAFVSVDELRSMRFGSAVLVGRVNGQRTNRAAAHGSQDLEFVGQFFPAVAKSSECIHGFTPFFKYILLK